MFRMTSSTLRCHQVVAGKMTNVEVRAECENLGPTPDRAPVGQEVVEEELRTYMTGCDTALACVRAD